MPEILPDLSQLPPEAGAGAIVLALVVILVWTFLKAFAGEGGRRAGAWFWRRERAGRGTLGRDALGRRDLRRYRDGVREAFDRRRLDFLSDKNSTVSVRAVYVPLEYEQDGRRGNAYREIIGRTGTVVLGAAGAGKSMLLRDWLVRWADKPGGFRRIPVMVELSRFNTADAIDAGSVDALIREAFRLRGVKRSDRLLARALGSGQLSVFFDGLDEVVAARREEVTAGIRRFAERHPTCQVVVTCRDAVYEGELAPAITHQVRIAGFDDAGIRHFLRRWLRRDDPARDVQETVEQMMTALRDSPDPAMMRLARSPLLLTMIAFLHDADPGIGPMISASRAEFYQLAVDHLLRRDRAMGKSGTIATYRPGHKLRALRRIALAGQEAKAPGSKRWAISEEDLLGHIEKVLVRYRLDPAEHTRPMLDEIVHRSGLLVLTDKGDLLYEFPHLTLQEYLAADELAAAPDRLLALWRADPDRWRETVKLWCASANRDCTDLVRSIFADDRPDPLLALECLAEADEIDEHLAEEIVDHHLARVGAGDQTGHLVVAALGAVAAHPGPRGEKLFGRLKKLAEAGSGTGRDEAMRALAATRLRPAIETISNLAGDLAEARSALRSMGDLAVPVLTDRATGTVAWQYRHIAAVDAVDDLAAIGTPASALAIASLLWHDAETVAQRAAWRMAALIRDPDSEETLSRAEFEPPTGFSYPWLWEPFSDESSSLRLIMGRAGWLIEETPEDQIPPDIDGIDPRVALGLGARTVEGGVQGLADVPKDSELAGELESLRLVRLTGTKRLPVRPIADLDGDDLRRAVGEVLTGATSIAPDRARAAAMAVLETQNPSSCDRALLGTLPTSALINIATRDSGSKWEVRDWRKLSDDPQPPRQLRVTQIGFASLAVAAGVALVGLGLVRAGGTVLGFWPWGPAWLSIATLVAAFVAAVFAVDAAESDLALDIANWTFLGAATVAVAGLGVLAGTTVAGWVGWWVTVIALVVIAAGTAVSSLALNRRERALANPFRAVLQAIADETDEDPLRLTGRADR